MRITANKLDDLRKAREEYDADLKKMKDEADANVSRWRQADYKTAKELEAKISSMIGSTSLDLQIYVRTALSFRNHDGWEISIKANDNKKFSEDIALAWNWEVTITDDGEVKKDSGSWSGLKATTPAQIADLEESVRILKLLNNMDWKFVLDTPPAKFEDYTDAELDANFREKRNNRPKFEDDILNAFLEDAIDKDIVIQLRQDSYYNGKCGILVTGLTDKFIKGYIFPWSLVGTRSAEDLRKYAYEPRRTSKDNVISQNGEPISQEV